MGNRAGTMAANALAKMPIFSLANNRPKPLANIPDNPLAKNPLAKIQSPMDSMSPDFSPMPAQRYFSPMVEPEFSPMKSEANHELKKPQNHAPAKSPIKENHRASTLASRTKTPSKKSAKQAPGLKLVEPKKPGKRGRPRNQKLPPAPGDYWNWTKAGNGLKLERRDDLRGGQYEYIGFIMPEEWEHLRGIYDESYILRIITAAIRVKRARTAARRSPGQNVVAI